MTPSSQSIEEQLIKFSDWVWNLSPHNRDRILDNIKQFLEFNLQPYLEAEKRKAVEEVLLSMPLEAWRNKEVSIPGSYQDSSHFRAGYNQAIAELKKWQQKLFSEYQKE